MPRAGHAAVGALADVGVERIVPRPLHRLEGDPPLAQALPDAFVQPLAGTVLRF